MVPKNIKGLIGFFTNKIKPIEITAQIGVWNPPFKYPKTSRIVINPMNKFLPICLVKNQNNNTPGKNIIK